MSDQPPAADRPGDADEPALERGLSAAFGGKRRQRTTLSSTQGPNSVLQRVESRLGKASRVLLRDEDSEHGVSPLLQRQSAPAAERNLPAGRGNYQVLGEIARGGMGVVLKGHDTDLGRDVAMKVLLEEHASSDTILQRFVEEAQIGGQLQHPGIVPVYELGLLDDDRPYFTMKLVKGRTLAALFADRRDRSEGRRRFLAIFEQVCQTIAYAHARKVIHRDLKPANIMVGAFGEVQVVDWGLAKVLREGGIADERRSRPAPAPAPAVSIIETVRSGSLPSAGSQSLVGSVMGTPAYMSPEQAQGEVERLDERTDVFALGGILAEILTGRPPYTGEKDKVLVEAARALQDGVRAALASCEAEAELVDLALRCLAANRDLRPSNAGALAREMHDFLASSEERARAAELAAAQARVKAEQERKARRVTLTLAAVVLLAVVGGGYGWQQLREEQAEQLATSERRQREVAGKVAALLGDVQLLRGQEQWQAARVALDQADAVLSASSDAAPGLPEQVALARTGLDEAERVAQAAIDARDRMSTLLTTLDELQFRNEAARRENDEHRRLAADFRAAFAAFGLDVLGGDPLQLAAAIRSTGQAEPIGLALDSWARSVLIGSGFDAPEFTRLIQLAMDVDPDPLRLKLRRALLSDDRAAFAQLAASPDVRAWPPETVITFVQAVGALGHPIEVGPLLAACSLYHPENPIVAMLLGWEVRNSHPERPDEALQYFRAARALRPGYTSAVFSMLRIYLMEGRYDEAVDLAVAHLAHDPTAESAFGFLLPRLGEGLMARDQYQLAVELFRRAREIAPDSVTILNNLAWFLCVHPDPARREPALAEEAARRALELEPTANAYNTLGIALYRAGKYRESIEMLRQSMERAGGGLAVEWLVVAMDLEHLGLHAEALPWYERGTRGVLTNPIPPTRDNFLLPEGYVLPDDTLLFLAEARALFGDE